GYSPFSGGCRNQTLLPAWKRSAAAASSAEAEAGSALDMLNAGPSWSGGRVALIARDARPCARCTGGLGRRKAGGALAAGGVAAQLIAQVGEYERLVEDAPDRDAVGERPGDVLGVVGEAARQVTVGPAALVFESLGQVPVIEGRKGPDSCLQQAVH